MALHSSRGDARGELLHRTANHSQTFAWLEDDWRPLDWNGPAYRLFRRFREQELQRPIIEHFERTARRYRERIAIREGDTTLTYGELWDGASGLAERLARETKPGDLIGLLMPACPMFPLVMLACFASGRPFVVLDPRYPPEWLDHVLCVARPAAIVTLADGLVDIEARMPAAQIIRLTGLPHAAGEDWRPTSV